MLDYFKTKKSKNLLFKKLIDQITEDENVHVKFVDAFLNLVGRVFNLSVRGR